MVLRDHVIYLSHSAHGKCSECVDRVPSAPACLHLWAIPMLDVSKNERESRCTCSQTMHAYLQRAEEDLESTGARRRHGGPRSCWRTERGRRNEREVRATQRQHLLPLRLTRQTGTVKAERGSACRLKLYLPQINPRAAPVVHGHWDEAPIKRAWWDTGIKPSRAFHRREDTAWRDIKRLRNLLVWVCVCEIKKRS